MLTPFRLASALWLAAVFGAAPLIAQEVALPQITFRDLLDGFKNTSRWLTYSGDYTGRRHSPLNQITPENVHLLSAPRTFQGGAMAAGRCFEVTLIPDGILYITGNNNFTWAVDSRTGRQVWRYRRELPSGTHLRYGPGKLRHLHAEEGRASSGSPSNGGTMRALVAFALPG